MGETGGNKGKRLLASGAPRQNGVYACCITVLQPDLPEKHRVQTLNEKDLCSINICDNALCMLVGFKHDFLLLQRLFREGRV